MSLPVEQIESLLNEIENADPYDSAAIAARIHQLVDDAANGDRADRPAPELASAHTAEPK